MKRTVAVMGRLSLLLVACLIGLSCERENPSPTDQMISVGSHDLQIHREGKGTPTVVIEAGITDRLENWRALQERIAQVTHIITYNRAGYGQSEAGPLPRDCDREAEELKALLTRYVADGRSTPGERQENAGGAEWAQLWWM